MVEKMLVDNYFNREEGGREGRGYIFNRILDIISIFYTCIYQIQNFNSKIECGFLSPFWLLYEY